MARKAAKQKPPARTNDEIRSLLLQYFYGRNRNATSARGSKGVAARISDIRKDLKAAYGLTQQEVWSNLTYLISQGWVEEEQVKKDVPLKSGMVVSPETSYYKITALGIDKIEGPGEFTVDKFKGIKIEATGQNIITVGDGNQVNARYQDAAGALVELKHALLASPKLDEEAKLNVVADIDTIQSQLAKSKPNKSVVKGVWEGVKEIAVAVGLAANAAQITQLLDKLL